MASEDPEEGARREVTPKWTMEQEQWLPAKASTWDVLRFFLTPIDGRYEDMGRGDDMKWSALRDWMAGLVVAMVAIPMAMGFAIASGLLPEQGIVGGAVAGLFGALFGGSKYQVYGPTAAFIPVIAGMIALFKEGGEWYVEGDTPAAVQAKGHAFIVFVSCIAGAVLCLMGLKRVGGLVDSVPQAVVVGFTIGIAITIAASQVEGALGIPSPGYASFPTKVRLVWLNIGKVNPHAIAVAALTFVLTKTLTKVSVYIPAAFMAVIAGTVISSTVWSDKGLVTVKDRYGQIPCRLTFTPPALPPLNLSGAWNTVYFTIAIVFVCAIESLLCSRMADRLAGNTGLPFCADKELWGQGVVQLTVPLLNGFPHTGALARTGMNIKVGAVSPLAGICKFANKLCLAYFFSPWLSLMPMASVAGLMFYIASAMLKPDDIAETATSGRFNLLLMLWTAIAVVLTDFLRGVLSAVAIYAVRTRFFADSSASSRSPALSPEQAKVGTPKDGRRGPKALNGSTPQAGPRAGAV